MIASVLTEPDVRYPAGSHDYSPDTAYPEYRGGHVAPEPNPVYAMVRRLLQQAGLDGERFGRPDWNPLGRFIRPGASVFVLCNFVYHRRPQESEAAFFSKCTHGSVLRAVLDYVLLAAGPTGRIRFGNSALQSCRWEQVLEDTGADRVARFFGDRRQDVRPVDLRLHVAERNALGSVVRVERRPVEGHAVEVALDGGSLLDRLPGAGSRFRISDYNPERLASFHDRGRHRYVIAGEVLAADTVLSVPKLKTHEKVGITCSLKGYVGMVGHKDCLAHHRFGGPRSGGDEYPAGGWLLWPLAHYHDWLNRRRDGAPFQGAFQTLERAVRKAARSAGMIMSGAWSGNDTAWRMTLDLSRIARYADGGGSMRDSPQRNHIALIDGIIAGEGEGPLSPSPAGAGTLVFSDDVVLGDRIACRLMGFDPGAVPLVDRAREVLEGPEPVPAPGRETVVLNGSVTTEGAVTPVLGRKFLAPRGWRGVL